jgi:hypothetical protein
LWLNGVIACRQVRTSAYILIDAGVWPALALDGAGNPRIAYDAEHRQGGACGAFTDTKLARFIQFNGP